MAQLGAQDPLNPMDSQAFVAQLATFANVEQLQAANKSLDGLLVAETSGNQLAAASLVGKDVSFANDRLTVVSGARSTLTANLPTAATDVTAVMTDSTGKIVRTLRGGAQPAGTLSLDWDGRDDSGIPVPPGEYTVQLTATNIDGASVDIRQRSTGRVAGVSFEQGYPELLVGGEKLKLADVLEVRSTP